MRVGKYFTLGEFTFSQTAIRNNIDNTPNAEQIENIEKLCNRVLDPLREQYKMPVRISSGFRSIELNKRIGGAPNSDHTRGHAADIEIPGIKNSSVAKWISENLTYNQLIAEFIDENIPESGWIHVSFIDDARNKNEELSFIRGKGVRKGLHFS